MNESSKISLNPISILRDTISVLQLRLGKIIIMTAIVAIPGSILRVSQLDTAISSGIISTFAGMFLSVALTWSFLNEKDLLKNSFAKVYVLSSSRVLPFIAVTVLLSLITMPLLAGVYFTVLFASSQLPVIFSIIGFILIIAVVYFLLRFSLSTILVVKKNITSIGSMKLSWKLTKNHKFMIFISWLMIILIIILSSGLILDILNLITIVRSNDYIIAVCNGLILTFALPLFICYGVQITKRLEV